MDLITGGSHFKVDVRRGLEIIRALRGHTTGYAVPQYVIDAPGGGGKVPINPDFVEQITDEEVIFRNYEGARFTYPLMTGKPKAVDGSPLPAGGVESIVVG
jgi:lysine 2,3-aminomutase